ncbi:MAG: class I SAM-dependent methyltransferase [Candidatus Lambdaproteobacteria bacterium]|nr:class I SAM-dependent methyltransferase [Candidatus Lambdaproteobacteria bacterium]
MHDKLLARRYLEHPVGGGFGTESGFRGRLRRALVSQFGHPRGCWGHVAGWIMAHRRSNIERNRWTVALLDVRPQDRVLEIGFGPGIAIAAVAERLAGGQVLGVDHSTVMVHQAARRDARAVADGRVRLVLGDVADVPAEAGPFQKILAVNAVMFWGEPVLRLRELRARLAPGGTLALTLQPRAPKATDADAQRAGEHLVAQLREAGFAQVRLETLPLRPVNAVCALAVK